jgi:hypothetical protein
MAKSWYYVDALNQQQGPFDLDELRAVALEFIEIHCFDSETQRWNRLDHIPPPVEEALPEPGRRLRVEPSPGALSRGPRSIPLDADGQPTVRRLFEKRQIANAVDTIMGMCRGVLADGRVSEEEARALLRWIEVNPVARNEWAIAALARRLDAAMSDGVVTEEELRDLRSIMDQMLGGVPDPKVATPQSTRLPVDIPTPDLVYPGRSFCVTGKFVYGSRDRVESTLQTRGARVVPRVVIDLDYLLVGSIASPAWKHGNYGTKIEAAVKYKARGASGRPWIIAEDHWVRLT